MFHNNSANSNDWTPCPEELAGSAGELGATTTMDESSALHPLSELSHSRSRTLPSPRRRSNSRATATAMGSPNPTRQQPVADVEVAGFTAIMIMPGREHSKPSMLQHVQQPPSTAASPSTTTKDSITVLSLGSSNVDEILFSAVVPPNANGDADENLSVQTVVLAPTTRPSPIGVSDMSDAFRIPHYPTHMLATTVASEGDAFQVGHGGSAGVDLPLIPWLMRMTYSRPLTQHRVLTRSPPSQPRLLTQHGHTKVSAFKPLSLVPEPNSMDRSRPRARYATYVAIHMNIYHVRTHKSTHTCLQALKQSAVSQ